MNYPVTRPRDTGPCARDPKGFCCRSSVTSSPTQRAAPTASVSARLFCHCGRRFALAHGAPRRAAEHVSQEGWLSCFSDRAPGRSVWLSCSPAPCPCWRCLHWPRLLPTSKSLCHGHRQEDRLRETSKKAEIEIPDVTLKFTLAPKTKRVYILCYNSVQVLNLENVKLVGSIPTPHRKRGSGKAGGATVHLPRWPSIPPKLWEY